MKEEVYLVGGMHCAACSASVEKVLRRLDGVEAADVNLMTEKLCIRYDEARVSPELIIQKIEKAGFTAEPYREEKDPGEERARDGLRLTLSCVFAGLVMAVSMGGMFGLLPALLSPGVHPLVFACTQLALSIPVMILCRSFYIGGFGALLRGNPDMNTLVALSSAASFLFSVVQTCRIPAFPGAASGLYYEAGATVLALVSVGKYLEARCRRKTGDAIRRLSELAPDEAVRVLADGSTERVPVASLYLGDILLIRAGDRVPADAEVTKGTASADESMLTGESLPVPKGPGDRVHAGTVLNDGAVYAKTEAIGHDTFLSSIVRFVSDAQLKKAPIARIADRIAGFFVPAVCAVALLSAVIWLLAGSGIAFALRIFTSVLVIACPCAMGLATPTAIMAGTGLGASHGILFRSGEALEKTAGIRTAVFDKTGTVTEGRLHVREVCPAPGVDPARVLSLAASLEQLSSHPIADGIRRAAEERGLPLTDVSDFVSTPGRGVRALAEQKELRCGSAGYCGVSDSAEEGCTAVCLTEDGTLLGSLLLADTVRKESPEVFRLLSEMKIRTVLLSGDSRGAAGAVGTALGCDTVYSGILPEGKAEVILGLRGDGPVMMVGDGINDAPALAVADVGAAVGSGTDIAMESADVILLQGGVSDLPKALRIGALTVNNIKINLFWAFCYNILAIPLACGVLYPAFGILLTPVIGSIAMCLSSLFVVTNALRLGRARL